MSNDTTTRKRPTHLAYSVRGYQKQGQMQSEWTRIGVAWQHKDGEGFDIVLEAIPVNGRIAIRTNKPKSEQEASERGHTVHPDVWVPVNDPQG